MPALYLKITQSPVATAQDEKYDDTHFFPHKKHNQFLLVVDTIAPHTQVHLVSVEFLVQCKVQGFCIKQRSYIFRGLWSVPQKKGLHLSCRLSSKARDAHMATGGSFLSLEHFKQPLKEKMKQLLRKTHLCLQFNVR